MGKPSKIKNPILRIHNGIRKEISKGKAPGQPKSKKTLKNLKWDNKLEKSAAKVAKTCNYKHSSGNYGENLFAGYHSQTKPDSHWAKLGSELWRDELADFRRPWKAGNAKSCKPGKKCGHYTQMVWEKTTRIGCALAYCRKLTRFRENSQFLVCHYGPGGNYRNETPYTFASNKAAAPTKSKGKKNSTKKKNRTIKKSKKKSRKSLGGTKKNPIRTKKTTRKRVRKNGNDWTEIKTVTTETWPTGRRTRTQYKYVPI